MNDLKAVYTVPGEQSALGALEVLGDKWDKKYPKLSKPWKDDCHNLSTYFNYPQEKRYVRNALNVCRF